MQAGVAVKPCVPLTVTVGDPGATLTEVRAGTEPEMTEMGTGVLGLVTPFRVALR